MTASDPEVENAQDGRGRSAFVARFSEIFDHSPMAILPDLRMLQAALDLTTTSVLVDVVAYNAGHRACDFRGHAGTTFAYLCTVLRAFSVG